eukprot:COSAG06_NODE_52_length_28059_cov_48.831378_8_plen_247_part_00
MLFMKEKAERCFVGPRSVWVRAAVAAKPPVSTPVHHFHFAVFRSKWIPLGDRSLAARETGTWSAHCNLTPMRRKCEPKRARARANGNARTTPQLPHRTWYVQCLAAPAHICPRISFPLRLHGRRGACMGEAGCCHAARLRAYTPGSSYDLGCIHYLLSRSHAGERATRQAMTMKGSNLVSFAPIHSVQPATARACAAAPQAPRHRQHHRRRRFAPTLSPSQLPLAVPPRSPPAPRASRCTRSAPSS